MMNSNAFRLFLLGFLTLFLELTFIRYLAGSIWNMGYFPNLVLMGVFLGMGIGFVFHHTIPEDRSSRFFLLSAFWILVLVSFICRFQPSVPGFQVYVGRVGGEVYFSASTKASTTTFDYVNFILIFVFILLIFAFLSQRTAKVFRTFAPLKAYTLDILGSCCGILSFMLISWLQIPAYIWFCPIIVVYWLIEMASPRRMRLLITVMLAIVMVLVWTQDKSLPGRADVNLLAVKWSPYQKVTYAKGLDQRDQIFVNGIGHQVMMQPEALDHSFYQLPHIYRAQIHKPPFSDVLVIGAGSGNDVAVALKRGAKHVDAIEIDPVIAAIGRNYHPARPYADNRVSLIVDDARAFMTYTQHRYDLIVFALTDSLVKVSPMSQLRLENYIFTQQSIERATQLLKPDGMIVFYNYYRLPWVQSKIQLMGYHATGSYPRTIYSMRDFAEMILSAQDHPPKPQMDEDVSLPQDDWPFLYLKTRGIPALYRNAMIVMGSLIGLLAILLHTTTRTREESSRPAASLKLAFVFMGAAFLLLETKSVIQFSLLFGTTWLNNSLVFLAVLLFVLAANWTASLLKGAPVLWIAFGLLLAFCTAAYFYPLGHLLSVQSLTARFVAASFLTFTPIFFANVIFSITFRDTKVPEHLFGWNLIGAAFGGVLEYSSLALGYNALTLVVASCYILVFILLRISIKSRAKIPTELQAAGAVEPSVSS